jgi:PTS system mannose-specific IIA component
MLGLLVVSHGHLAEQLVDAVRTIVGDVEALESVSIGWHDKVEKSSKRIEDAIRRVERGRGVLVLTDMFGGTPTNLALTLHKRDSIEIVTGVNLPMLIKFTSLRESLELHEAAAQVAERGREAIQVASQLLQAQPGGESS